MKITCGKYSKFIDLSEYSVDRKPKRIRIGSKNPNKLPPTQYLPISTNGEVIIYKDGTIDAIEFLKNFRGNIRLIVLTERERELIIEQLLNFNLDVRVFERDFPIFTNIKYTSYLKNNLMLLTNLLDKVKSLDVKNGKISKSANTMYQFKVERKLRFKNDTDPFFAFGLHGGYQEVFKIREERKDRAIIAFDFNSMFPSCMEGSFAEPKSITYTYKNINFSDSAEIENGLYRVILKYPLNENIKKYHPFRLNNVGESYHFNLGDEDEIETLLFKSEIEEYSKYFRETKIIEGLSSKRNIKHPLYNEALSLFKKRKHFKEAGNKTMSNYYKLLLVMLHSVTNPRKQKKINFKNLEELIIFARKKIVFDLDGVMDDRNILKLLIKHKRFSIDKKKDGYQLTLPFHAHHNSVISLSAQIVANSRVKVFQTINRFIRHSGVELCYINIDSLHISIPKCEVDAFLKKHRNILTDEIGNLKIQCIADKGFWFDVGRYWLYKDEQLIQYKNVNFNSPASKTPYKRFRRIKYVIKGELFKYVRAHNFLLENSFSYNKRLVGAKGLDYEDFERYDFNEISDFNVAGETYSIEILRSKQRKIKLFNKIATV